MAVTISWDGLRELAAFGAANGCAISLYVDLDPSVSPTAKDAAMRMNALLDEGRREAAAASRKLTHAQRQALRDDLDRIGSYYEQEFSRDGARGLAVFAARLDNVWKPIPLIEAVGDAVTISGEFYLAPLVPLVGRGDGALVAVVGRELGELFRLEAGRLKALVDRTEEQPRRHDQGGMSQSSFQRHIDELAERHLRRVAEELDVQVRRHQSPRVVVVTSEQTRSEFEAMLSSATKNALAGWTHAEAHATAPELLQAVEPVLEQWRAEQEQRAVERWRDEHGRSGRSSAGWAETLEAASDGRVETLLFEHDAERNAFACPECGRVSLDGGSCPLDGVQMEPEPSGLDLAVHRTLRHGGTAWSLQNRRDLAPVEGIAALLRY
jgi:peptide chain release factor subunit 1